MKFKTGDLVRTTRTGNDWHENEKGVVLEPPDEDDDVRVWIHDQKDWFLIPVPHLVHIAIEAPAIPMPTSDSERRRAAQYDSALALLRSATPEEVQAVIRLLMGMDAPVERDVIAADVQRRLLDLAPAPDAGNPDDLKLPAIVERLAERLAQQEARIGEERAHKQSARQRIAYWHDAAHRLYNALHSIAQRAEQDGDSAVCTLIAIQARDGLKIVPEPSRGDGMKLVGAKTTSYDHALWRVGQLRNALVRVKDELELNGAVNRTRVHHVVSEALDRDDAAKNGLNRPVSDPTARKGAIGVIRANLFELERLRDGADVRYVDGVVEQAVFNAESARIALLIEEALDALDKLEAPHQSDAPARRRNVSAHVRAYLKEVRRMVQNPSVHASSDVVEHLEAALARLDDLDAL